MKPNDFLEWEWQKIDESTAVMRVPGGWIVRSFYATAYGNSMTQTFVPYTE